MNKSNIARMLLKALRFFTWTKEDSRKANIDTGYTKKPSAAQEAIKYRKRAKEAERLLSDATAEIMALRAELDEYAAREAVIEQGANKDTVKAAARKAARTGSRYDVQEYMRARRKFI